MSKHTPGPWRVVDGHYPCMKEIEGPSFRVTVVMWATDLDFNDYLVRSADANLIAAAPDLLEALTSLELISGIAAPHDDPARVAARAAITKARGGGE